MNRNLQELSNHEFDVVVIGGGIYGAALAREARLAKKQQEKEAAVMAAEAEFNRLNRYLPPL